MLVCSNLTSDNQCRIINKLAQRSVNLGEHVCQRCVACSIPMSQNEVTLSVASLFREREEIAKPRPLLIRGIERQRIPTDTGVGDTVHRILSKMGGTQFKWVMARLGVNCGCEDRKQYLNRVYPYGNS